tara:strand:- start:181 stop:1167 length:987 start_codon:yes stop_codon:yes gene_type:complete
VSEDSRKLSTDEVSALMAGIESGELGEATGIGKDLDVKSFNLGENDATFLGDFFALRMVNEKLARAIRPVFQPMLHYIPRVNADTPKIVQYEKYTEPLSNFMSLTIFKIEELKGPIMLSMSPEFVSMLTNTFYGGQMSSDSNGTEEFTPTEEGLISMIGDRFLDALVASWAELEGISSSQRSHETNPKFALFVEGDELVMVCRFTVQIPEMEPATIDLVYPLQTLKPIGPKLRARINDSSEDNGDWSEKLQRAVFEIPLRVTALLAEPVVSVGKLTDLMKGDLLVLNVENELPVRIADQTIFSGILGEINGNTAVDLRKLETKAGTIN